MESIDLNIPIKLVSAATNKTNEISEYTASSTGDFFAIVLIIIALVTAASSLFLCLYSRSKKTSANAGTNPEISFNIFDFMSINNSSKIKKIYLSFIAIIFSVSVAVVVSLGVSNHALGINSNDLKGNEILGYVDEDSGNISFDIGSITNFGQTGAVVSKITTSRPNNIDDGNANWTINSGNITLFNGTTSYEGRTITPSEELLVQPNGGSIPISVEVDGLSGNTAKSLIGQNVVLMAFSLIDEPSPTKEVKQVTNIKFQDQSVNYLPAFNDDEKSYLKNNGVKYYTDAQRQNPAIDINNTIEQGCTMAELYNVLTAHSTKKVETLYAEANVGVKFYAVVDNPWNTTFNLPDSVPGVAKGLNKGSSLYKTLMEGRQDVTTAYFANNDDTTDTASGNWSHTSDDQPTLNNTTFNDFQLAYNPLLSQWSNWTWSSQIGDNSIPYYWSCVDNIWKNHTDIRNSSGIVLVLTFDDKPVTEKKDPEFKTDQSMPTEGSTYETTINGPSLATTATTQSDGEALAYTSDENIAKVSVAKSSLMENGETKITYTVEPISTGKATISLGVNQTDVYKADARTFEIDITKELNQVTNIKYQDQNVNYLPAFNDEEKKYLKDNGVKYYYDTQRQNPVYDINNAIEDGCTMFELYNIMTAHSTKDPETLYAKANDNVKFYAVVDNPWNDTFNLPDDAAGVAKGLNKESSLYKTLIEGRSDVTTVYYANNDDTTDTAQENWSHTNDTQPTLNSTFYNDFRSAYNTLLSTYSTWAWSSRIGENSVPFYWSTQSSGWYNNTEITNSSGIVLILTFSDSTIAKNNYQKFELDQSTPENAIIEKGITNHT